MVQCKTLKTLELMETKKSDDPELQVLTWLTTMADLRKIFNFSMKNYTFLSMILAHSMNTTVKFTLADYTGLQFINPINSGEKTHHVWMKTILNWSSMLAHNNAINFAEYWYDSSSTTKIVWSFVWLPMILVNMLDIIPEEKCLYLFIFFKSSF